MVIVIARFENENQAPTEKANREVRRAPSFSGPLMLPNRASANSLSAPIKSSGGENSYCMIIGDSYRFRGFLLLSS